MPGSQNSQNLSGHSVFTQSTNSHQAPNFGAQNRFTNLSGQPSQQGQNFTFNPNLGGGFDGGFTSPSTGLKSFAAYNPGSNTNSASIFGNKNQQQQLNSANQGGANLFSNNQNTSSMNQPTQLQQENQQTMNSSNQQNTGVTFSGNQGMSQGSNMGADLFGISPMFRSTSQPGFNNQAGFSNQAGGANFLSSFNPTGTTNSAPPANSMLLKPRK